jgi:hypothetical protein
MRRTILIILLSIFVITVSASIVFAGNTYDPKIKNKIMYQKKRIHKGIASGCLTRAEARTLQGNLNRIMATELRLKADGHLTKRERNRLHQYLNRNSKKIYFKKHNTARRWY